LEKFLFHKKTSKIMEEIKIQKIEEKIDLQEEENKNQDVFVDDKDDEDFTLDEEVEEEDQEEEQEVELDIKFNKPKTELEDLQNQRLFRSRKEQRQMLLELKEKQKKEIIKTGKNDKFKFLLQQTEIFSNYSSNSKETSIKKEIEGKVRNSKSEKEEDEEILKDSEESIIPKSVRITTSPYFIENTKLRQYQLHGLNWLVKQFDNGLNSSKFYFFI
jgi:hypothetical protein